MILWCNGMIVEFSKSWRKKIQTLKLQCYSRANILGRIFWEGQLVHTFATKRAQERPHGAGLYGALDLYENTVYAAHLYGTLDAYDETEF